MLGLTTAQIYEYVLSRVQEQLEKDGYKRSGKGTVFYRYHTDKRLACVVGMQKSFDNGPESLFFTFNLDCVTVDEIMEADPTFFGPALNLTVLKTYLRSILSERIGHVCRGGDAWYEVSEYSLMGRKLSQYYDDTIGPDIDMVIKHLNDLVKNKSLRYNET